MFSHFANALQSLVVRGDEELCEPEVPLAPFDGPEDIASFEIKNCLVALGRNGGLADVETIGRTEPPTCCCYREAQIRRYRHLNKDRGACCCLPQYPSLEKTQQEAETVPEPEL